MDAALQWKNRAAPDRVHNGESPAHRGQFAASAARMAITASLATRSPEERDGGHGDRFVLNAERNRRDGGNGVRDVDTSTARARLSGSRPPEREASTGPSDKVIAVFTKTSSLMDIVSLRLPFRLRTGDISWGQPYSSLNGQVRCSRSGTGILSTLSATSGSRPSEREFKIER